MTFTFQVYDSLTSANPAQGSFTLDVVPRFQPPALLSIPTSNVDIGQSFTLDVGKYAYDPNTSGPCR